MPTNALTKHSLVLYKLYPARVESVGDKFDIALPDGKKLSVRAKDITLLHPGPLRSLSELTARSGEVKTAWELLAGSVTNLPELADLIYEVYTPATAWAAWQLVAEGLYFYGDDPAEISARSAEEVAQLQAEQVAKAQEKAQYKAFLKAAQTGQLSPAADQYLTEVELLACGQQDKSRVLQDLDIAQNPENAHALLLRLGVWDDTRHPYPERLGVTTTPPDLPLPDLPDEPRRDLTHLPAFAIDDAGSTDPDDAISLDGERLWVHIADVAALVTPDSPVDLEARARGASLYLPEGTVTMLPPAATPRLGLGLAEVSPALSFGITLDENDQATLAEVTPSWIKVSRLSYAEAETRLEEAPLRDLHQLAKKFMARRQTNGAVELDLPEVKVRVEAGQVKISPIQPLQSRIMVRESMLMVGEAVANFAQTHDIPLLYSTQEIITDGTEKFSDTLAGNFARLRTMQRSQLSSIPAPHAGLGLESYAQATSPLRRYADLVAHQQLRAYLTGRPLLDKTDALERVGTAEAISGSTRQAERLANKHWTLVYLRQNPDWQGEAVLVEHNYRRARLIIPALDLTTQLSVPKNMPLDSTFTLRVKDTNLPALEAYFKIIS